jgi:hypothetical protein
MRAFAHCFIFLLSFSAFSQDSLFLVKGTKEAVVLLEVNPDNLRYKRFDNQTGPTYTILKKEVILVKYKNGKKDVFTEVTAAEKPKENVVVPVKDTIAKEKNPPAGNAGKDEGIFAGDIPDTLIFRSGKRTEAKVLIVAATEVRYKLFSYQDGPTYNAAKFELKSIHYGRGTVENFNENASSDPVVTDPNNNTNRNSNPTYDPPKDQTKPDPVFTDPDRKGRDNSSVGDLYQKGQADAVKHYKHNGGSIGVGCGAAACSPLGWIPAMIVADKPPKDYHLTIPKGYYTSDPEYIKGYKNMAHQMKRKRVWRGYSIGATLGIAFWVLAASN